MSGAIPDIPSFPPGVEPGQRIAFFLGAGTSRLIGCPGWDDLAVQLAGVARSDDVGFNHQDGSLLTGIADNKMRIGLIEGHYHERGKHVLFRKRFAELVDPDETHDPRRRAFRKNISLFRTIAEFSNLSPEALFITTNADVRFNKGGSIFSTEIIVPGQKIDAIQHGRCLYRLHGSLEKPDSLIFTMQQYLEMYSQEDFNDFIGRVFSSGYRVFFLGTSLSEVELLKYYFKKQRNHMYWLRGYYSSDARLFHLEQKAYQALGISILPFCMDQKGYEQTITVVQEWYDGLIIKTDFIPHSARIIDDAATSTDQEA